MNENIDLTKILDGCPIRTAFYNTVYGECTLLMVSDHRYYPIVLKTYREYDKRYAEVRLTRDGRTEYSYNGECTLFPSKEQRDWSRFERFWDKPKVERFDVNTLQPYDKVLAKDGFSSKWTCSFFSHMDNEVSFPVYCSGGYFKVCIPYNEDTKHLVGTSEDCPDYYKWWEE